MPLPLLGPIIAALGEAAASLGASGIGAAAARGASGLGAMAGHVLEDTGLTNAKSITAALRGGMQGLFKTPSGAAENAASRGGLNLKDWLGGSSGHPGGLSGMAAKFAGGDWSAGNPMRDAMRYGVPTSATSNSSAKFAAGDWNPDPDWQGRRDRQQAEQTRRQNMMTAGAAIAPILGGAVMSGLSSAGGRMLSGLGLSGLRGTNEIGEGAGDLLSQTLNPLKWFTNPTGFADAILKIGKGIAHLPFDIENQSLALIDSQRELRRFNGVIANNIALLDRQDVMLKVRLANATAGTQSLATGSTMMLREELQPFKEFSENIKNLQQTILNVVTTGLIEGVDSVTGLKRTIVQANALLKTLSGEANARATPTNNLMMAMIGRQLADVRHVRPKPRRP